MRKNPYEFSNKQTGEIMTNSVGYQQVITTLTAVGRKVSEQRFFQIPFADYVPVVMGNGSYQRQILNWRTFLKGDSFESGIISNSSNNARVGLVDAAVDALYQPIVNWAKALEYDIFELEESMAAGGIYSLIEMKERSRRKLWDLGLQKVAFLGIQDQYGLLNQASAYSDVSTTLTNFIYTLSAADFNTFVGVLIEKYRDKAGRTVYPTHFIVPEKDWNGLANWTSSEFPLKTKLQALEEAFKTVCMNPGFKILPCAYGNKALNPDTTNKYALYNYDETSLKMDIPLNLLNTAANSVDGFTWRNIGYGQFTGVLAQRPAEIYYLTHTA